MAYLRLNDFDVMPYLEQGGWEYQDNDIDAPDSGRTLDGVMHRGKVTSKRKYVLSFLPLETLTLNMIMSIVRNEYVTVTTDSDAVVGEGTLIMYNSSRVTTCFRADTGRWDGLKISLIEQ